MRVAIRRATLADVPEMVAVKSALRLQDSTDGGFLLGTDASGYSALVAAAEAWVLVDGDRVVGFAIALPDAIVRQSELWTRREHIAWGDPGAPSAARGFDPSTVERGVIGYFDQLAVLPAWRHHPRSVALASRAFLALLDAGCTDVFATTVSEPVENRAAWALLARIGFRKVGRIDEVYPEFGPLVSDLHHVSADTARARLSGVPTRRSA